MTISIQGWQAPREMLNQLEEAFGDRASEVAEKIVEVATPRDRPGQISLARMALILANRGKSADEVLGGVDKMKTKSSSAARPAARRAPSRFNLEEDEDEELEVPLRSARPAAPAERAERADARPRRRGKSVGDLFSAVLGGVGRFWRKPAGKIAIPSTVLLLIAGGVFTYAMVTGSGRFSGQPAVVPSVEGQSAEQPAEPPKFKVTEAETVDLKSVDWYGQTQILLILATLAIPFLGYLDGKERLQIGDAIFAVVGAVANYLVMWAPVMAFITTLLSMDERSVAILMSFVIVVVVTVKALTGGRDTSSLGVYFGLLALGSAIFGNMGAMQVAFNVPSQPLYALQELPVAILAKQGELIKFSLLVYAMLGVAITNYVIDIIVPRDGDFRWEAIISAVVVVLAFYLALIKLQPALALLVAIAAAVLIAMILRRTGERRATRATGENPLTQVVQRVFEYTAWDGVAMGTILVVLLRLAGIA